VGPEILPDDLLHLVERPLGRRLPPVGLAGVADIEHGLGNDELALLVESLPEHVADLLAVDAVVEFRDEVEGNNDLFLGEGRDAGKKSEKHNGEEKSPRVVGRL